MGRRGPKQQPLNKKQRHAAMLLGQGVEQKEVAAEAGVDSSTITLWKRRQDFMAAVKDECDRTIAALRPQAIRHLQGLLAKEKPGWLTKSTCDSLLLLADRLEQVSAGQLTVSFTGGMPEPKMPAQAEHPEEQGDENE